jgi:hypothetical protein
LKEDLFDWEYLPDYFDENQLLNDNAKMKKEIETTSIEMSLEFSLFSR